MTFIIQKIDNVSNYLNDINILVQKEKSKVKETKIVESIPETGSKEDPFLDTQLSNDSSLINKVFGPHMYKY